MAAISKQEYLKRYLSNSDDGKKKKRKKKPSKGASKFPTSIIVDDDLTLKDIAACDVTHEANEIEADGEDAPAVYEVDGVTKISLETFKKREEDRKTKWAPISLNEWSSAGGQRDGTNSNRDREVLRDSMENYGRRQNTPDLSLQRNRFYDSPDESPPRKRHARSSPVRPISKLSAQVRERDVTQIDNSPPRSRRKRHDSGDSPPQQTRDISPDQSPARKRRLDEPGRSTGRRSRNDSPDLSPPRQKGIQSDSDQSPPRKRGQSDSDQSPPRKHVHSDSDQSPPRKHVHSYSDQSTPRKHDRSPNRGRKAGLLSAADLQKENERRRDREAEFFSKMDPSVSGKDTETVYRDKLGRKRDLKMERLKKREQERKETEENEKFMEWGRGVTQTKQIKEKVADDLHEMEKPLARYRDDKDLDSMLKAQEREDDPMLAYMKQRKVKQNIKEGKKDKPVYKGPDPPPNRFNIRPGYRWDGVDRSNGFEKKRFAMLANKMATQAQAYKWSTEDM